MDLDALLARAEAARADSWEDAQVVLAGEIVDVSLARVDGTTWVELAAAHHPRTSADGQFGYDAQAVSRVYPRVRVAGIDIAADSWTRLYDALDKVNQQTVDAAVWGVNVFGPERARLQALRDASEELAKTGVPEADVESAAAAAVDLAGVEAPSQS